MDGTRIGVDHDRTVPFTTNVLLLRNNSEENQSDVSSCFRIPKSTFGSWNIAGFGVPDLLFRVNGAEWIPRSVQLGTIHIFRDYFDQSDMEDHEVREKRFVLLLLRALDRFNLADSEKTQR